MSNNIDDLFSNVKKMVDSGNIPNDIKQMMNNLNSSNNSFSNNNNNDNINKINNNSENTSFNNNDLNNVLSQFSPEMLNNLSSLLNSNTQKSPQNSSTQDSQSNNFNFDINTIMKMKSIMENMNNPNDPRANLLYSLKPYLRDSKKNKLDQYVNLLNISKITDFMNKGNNEKNK